MGARERKCETVNMRQRGGRDGEREREREREREGGWVEGERLREVCGGE